MGTLNCKEFDDLTAITAIPVSKIDATAAASLAHRLTPTVPANLVAPTIPDPAHPGQASPNPIYEDAVTIGMQAVTGEDSLVPLRRGTAKAKDDESDSVAGRLHTVTASCEVDDRDGAVWADLLKLERTPGHLVLTFRNGGRAFVSATRDTYLCTVERDGAKTTVQFRIQDLMGVQPAYTAPTAAASSSEGTS